MSNHSITHTIISPPERHTLNFHSLQQFYAIFVNHKDLVNTHIVTKVRPRGVSASLTHFVTQVKSREGLHTLQPPIPKTHIHIKKNKVIERVDDLSISRSKLIMNSTQKLSSSIELPEHDDFRMTYSYAKLSRIMPSFSITNQEDRIP